MSELDDRMKAEQNILARRAIRQLLAADRNFTRGINEAILLGERRFARWQRRRIFGICLFFVMAAAVGILGAMAVLR